MKFRVRKSQHKILQIQWSRNSSLSDAYGSPGVSAITRFSFVPDQGSRPDFSGWYAICWQGHRACCFI